ncbi:MAG: hypothetical protein WCI17_00875 [bacterium]
MKIGVPKKCKDISRLTEMDVVRHFTNLSRQNFSVDASLYPPGSCITTDRSTR